MRSNRSTVFLALVLVLAAVTVVAACSPSQSSPKPTTAPAPAPKATQAPAATTAAPKPAPTTAPPAKAFSWPKGVSIVTPQMGSSAYTEVASWSTELERATKMAVRLVPEENTALSAQWHKQTEIDLMAQSETGMLYVITADYTRPDRQTRKGGPYDLRSVLVRPPGNRAFYAASDTGIKSFDDIRKKALAGQKVRIARFTNVPMYWSGLLKMLKLTEKDITFVDYNSFTTTADAVAEGNADVSWMTPEGAMAAKMEASPRGLTWLAFPTQEQDPEGIARYMEAFPYVDWGKGVAGVKSFIGTNTIIDAGSIWGRADLDNELVYNMLKWQMENTATFKDKTPSGVLINMETLKFNLDHTLVPAHDGVVRYAKEKGIWSAANEARQKYNLWLLGQYKVAYEAAIKEADSKGIQVYPKNKPWLDLWKRVGTEVYKLPAYFKWTDRQIQEKLAQIR